MDSHVGLKIGFLCKLSVTNFTAMGISFIIRSMDPCMNLQNFHGLETLFTHITLEILAVLMHQVMPLFQIFWRVELVTVLALGQQVLLYHVFPPVPLDLGDSWTNVITSGPVTSVADDRIWMF